jgi:hypothetical protein
VTAEVALLKHEAQIHATGDSVSLAC